MIKSLSIASLIILLLACSRSDAQTLNVNFDFATFRYDSLKSYVEFYYSFDVRAMKLVKGDSSYVDTLLFQVGLQRIGADSTRYAESWVVPVDVADTTGEQLKHTLVGQIGVAVPPGNYSMHITAIDMNDTTRIDTIGSGIMVPRYSFRKLETSDVELCSQITQAEPGLHGIFYKNTYDVVPNPKVVYGAGLPIIYYYVEVYNIPDSLRDSTFKVEYQVRDSYGQVRKSRETTKKKFGDSSVEVGTINGSDLKTGVYTLLFSVIDSAANAVATSSKRFFIYNPGLGAPEAEGSSLAGRSVLSTVFATMDSEQITREFQEARYIATSEEIQQFAGIQSLSAKRQFLYDFWQKRNPNPALNSNPTRIEYLRRVAYTNDHFTVGSTPGWQTDRGRVYILYGRPDQVDRHPNESNSKPYEIWYFNSVQGGVSFDFVDKTGFGNYTLVNSTARNEIHNDNWQQYLGTGY